MLRCSAQSDARQSTTGALGAVAYTFLFLTCFALQGKQCSSLGYFLLDPNIFVFFNTERSWNSTSAVI